MLCCNMARPLSAIPGAAKVRSQRIAPQELAKPVTRRDWPTYCAVLAGLREFCPPALPVVVRSARVAADSLGDCEETIGSS